MNHPYQSTRTKQSRHTIIGTATERCPYCAGARIIKKGKRQKKLETIQLWYCHDCACVFTPQLAKGKTYPLKVILAGLSLYHSGRILSQSTQRLKERYSLAITHVPSPPGLPSTRR